MQHRLAQALGKLDAWLETMRQPGGYGGPVVHWWQHRLQFTGPGHDWRYEGLLVGYQLLYSKTGDTRWRTRLEVAARDLVDGQTADGSYRASRFEINPGVLGTPHEAASSLGLLTAAADLDDGDRAIAAAGRNLAHLAHVLRDGEGIADQPGGHERVPNKLATLAHALLAWSEVAGDGTYDDIALQCLEDVLRFQVQAGPHAGAVHQYAPDGHAGDGRFFPYYASRCVPPLLAGTRVYGDDRLHDAAHRILDFLDRSMASDGSWPQVVYTRGRTAEWPRWTAGVADILLAYLLGGRDVPQPALSRLLDAQQPTGAFPTAHGFASKVRQVAPSGPPDVRDVVPVVGWNDKVLRLLATLMDDGAAVPRVATGRTQTEVVLGTMKATFEEDASGMQVHRGTDSLYAFGKGEPWAARCLGALNVR